MTFQNQTFAVAMPTATLSSASYAPSNILNVVASNENPGYGNYYYGQGYNDALPSLSYTVQQAIEFGRDVIDYSTSSRTSQSGDITYLLSLAADGCRQSNPSSEDAVYNCSIACVSPKYIFAHTPTMANCMAYGLIVDALIKGNVSDNFRRTAIKYGISENRTIADQVRSTILGCFNQCVSLGSCNRGTYASNSAYSSSANLTLYYEVADMCSGVPAPVMTDIAGIGVGSLCCSHERYKLTISARYTSHTGSKAALRSRLLL